jgi:hypothetical protein
MLNNIHIYETNSILQAVTTSVEPTHIMIFVEHHKGPDPTNLDELFTLDAAAALVIYFLSILILIGLLLASGLWSRHDSSPWRGP